MMFSVPSCFDSRTASSRRETFSQKKFKPMGTPPQVSVAFTAEDREFLWSGTGVFCAAGTPSRGFRTVGSTGFVNRSAWNKRARTKNPDYNPILHIPIAGV